MDKKEIKFNLPLLIAMAIAIALVVVGSFYDQNITSTLMNRNNLFAIIFTAIGNMPSIYIGVFGCECFLFVKTKTKFGGFLLKAAGICGLLFMNFFLYISSAEYAELPATESHETLFKIILLAFILLMNALVLYIAHSVSKKVDNKKLLKTSLMLVTIVVAYAGFTEVIKYLASRPRPRLVETGVQFRNWYEWDPLYALKNSEYKSFVSGHSSNSACLISLLPILLTMTKYENKNRYYWLAAAIGALFTYIVGFSRLIAGAHYLSDITAGIVLSCIIQIIAVFVEPVIYKKIMKE